MVIIETIQTAMKNKIITFIKFFLLYFFICTIALIIYDIVVNHTFITNYNFINDLRITIPISLVCSIAQLKNKDST